MKFLQKFLISALAFFALAGSVAAVTLLTVPQGGTGVGTLTGIVKGNGTAPFSVATAGTDYLNAVVADAPLLGSGTTVSHLTCRTASTSQSGCLSSADWNTFNSKEAALTFSTGLTRSVNTITANLSTGVSGGQSAIGGTGSGENLTLSSTSNATKGKILMGSSAFDEVNNRFGSGTTTPAFRFDTSTTTAKYGAGGTQVIYLPGNTAGTFSGTLFLGNGGSSITHSTGNEGQFNTYGGIGAGGALTAGLLNTGFGYSALAAATLAQENVGIGAASLSTLTNAAYDTAIGTYSGTLLTTGSYNTIGGYQSMAAATTAARNSTWGFQSLNTCTTCTDTVAIGLGTGNGITTGSQNTIIGANITGLATTLSNNILIADGSGLVRFQINNTGLARMASYGVGTYTGTCAFGLQVDSSGNIIEGSCGGGGSSPLTTKGDLYTHNSTVDARLAVGSNGQSLFADSGTATGIAWKTSFSLDTNGLTYTAGHVGIGHASDSNLALYADAGASYNSAALFASQNSDSRIYLNHMSSYMFWSYNQNGSWAIYDLSNAVIPIKGDAAFNTYLNDVTGNVSVGASSSTAPASTITVNGSSAINIVTITTTSTLNSSQNMILCDASGGAVTLNLPTAASTYTVSAGRDYTVKKIDSSANACTIDPNGAELIDGAGTKPVVSQYESYDFRSNGTAWWIH